MNDRYCAGRRQALICEINNMWRSILILLCSVIILGCRTEPINMQVIDAQNGLPISDTVAVYDLHAKEWHGYGRIQLAVYETKSDEEGQINIPSQYFFKILPTGFRSPKLYVFKNGYMPVSLSNKFHLYPSLLNVINWENNNEIIMLKKFDDHDSYINGLKHLGHNLDNIYGDYPYNNKCGWKAIPNIIIEQEFAVTKLGTTANEKNNYFTTMLAHLLSNEIFFNKCGSPIKFFSDFPFPCPDESAMLTNFTRRMQINENRGINTLHSLGYCPSDGQYWMHSKGTNWHVTSHESLDFLKDYLRPNSRYEDLTPLISRKAITSK